MMPTHPGEAGGGDVRFEKWQALGNDYLIIEAAELPFTLSAERIRRICDPHTGVGADGILLLSPPPDPEFVAGLRIFNPDGSEAELSGNGAREAIMYLRHRGFTDLDEFQIHTPAGPIRPRITGPDTCSVDMGRASTVSVDFPGGPPDGRGKLEAGGRTWSFRHVSIGNPQCAIRVADPGALAGLDLPAIGPALVGHPSFPSRTNVSWFTELEPGLIRARIFERGVGETLSSGTGASGAAVAYHLDGGPAAVTVVLDGGRLDVLVGPDLNVNLTGWARPVYRGELGDDFQKELDDTR
jgi:diaminopimelate epimerase